MSSLTTNPARRAVSARRALIAAEAVVSAYLNELAPTERRGREQISHHCTDLSRRSIARAPRTARSRTRVAGPRRRTALTLGA
jgi:hypothetical protein